jgi:ribosome-associated translation inhibitor RaiA
MAAVVAVHFKDMDHDDEIRNEVEERCQGLAAEFPELTHLEVTLSTDRAGHAASAHGTGKQTVLASHATGAEPRHAVDRLLTKLRHQLRRAHEKRIFARRRTAAKRKARVTR